MQIVPPPPLTTCTCEFSLSACPIHGTNCLGVVPPPPPPLAVNPPPKRINARNKGQRGEREVIALLQEAVDSIRARYSLPPLLLQRNTLQAHVGGEDLHGLAGFSVEVKFQEIPYQPAWWQQCLIQAERSNGVPILFWRMSRMPWQVKMRIYANTPKDRDQVEMDVVVSLEDFCNWFADAYDEACVDELQRNYH